MNYENHTVLLENGTIGTVERSSIDYQDINGFVGEELTVSLHDENGDKITQHGVVAEVLEVAYLDQ